MKIAILGYGVEGKSAYNYYRHLYPEADIIIMDELPIPPDAQPADVDILSGSHIFDNEIIADIACRSPAISPHKIRTSGRVTSATREFFDKCPAPIIGVTGTKGKGTTSSFIHAILCAAGKKSWLVGNIGISALDLLPDISTDNVVVYELSSFQLWDLEKSPHVAVVLMIEPDHLDTHKDFDDYVAAKSNIVRWQTESDIVVHEGSRGGTSAKIAELSAGQKVPYNSDQGVHILDNYIWHGEQKLCSTAVVKIPGKHNLENAAAAVAATWEYVQDPTIIAKGLSSFEGLPHRLKFVRELNGVSYYDDSIATTPGSAIAAINSFTTPKILILGGSDKGSDFTDLYQAIIQNDVRHVITIGAMGQKIATELKAQGYENITECIKATMSQIVSTAQELSEPGDVMIMSPACASFDMFKSYSDRGEQFVAAVESLE